MNLPVAEADDQRQAGALDGAVVAEPHLDVVDIVADASMVRTFVDPSSTACTPSAVNIGSSLWLCTIAAPSAMPSSATSAISAGVRGTWRLRERGVAGIIRYPRRELGGRRTR